jgi:hypothetical protein
MPTIQVKDAAGATQTIETITPPIAPVISTALEASHVIKGSAGSLFDWYVTTTQFPGYVMIFDATSAPADGAVTPKMCFAVGAGSTFISPAGKPPTVFATGITFVFSTTGPFIKTASASAFISAKAI